MSEDLGAMRERYEKITTEALAVAKAAPILQPEAAAEVFEMVVSYLSDGKYFFAQGDVARSLAAFSYAHGWLDCGARMKFYDVHDDRLFTVDGKK